MSASRVAVLLMVNLRLCLLEIFSNPARSIISVLGIFLGTASLLVNMAFMRAMQDNIAKSLDQMGGATILVIKEKEPEDEEQELEFHRSGGLKMSEVNRIAKDIPGVESVLRFREVGWGTFRSGGKRTHGRIVAIGPDYHRIYNYQLDQGREFTPLEYQGRARVCIVGPRIGDRLFGEGEPLVGKTITIERTPCEIVGVIATKSRWDHRSRECHVPYELYKQTVGVPDKVSEVSVKVTDVSVVEEVRDAFTRQLQVAHRGVEDFEVEASLDKIKEMENASMGIRIVIGAIAFISLCVGAISIMNTMFGTIGDRIREIGLRKALGARQSDLFAQFLLEAVLLSFVGGLPGMLPGFIFTMLPENTFPFEPALSVLDYSIAAFFVAVAGLVSGLFPALKAARMEPVEALRY